MEGVAVRGKSVKKMYKADFSFVRGKLLSQLLHQDHEGPPLMTTEGEYWQA